MSAATASGMALAWLNSLLFGATAITNVVGDRIVSPKAPQGTPYPLIQVQQITSVDRRGPGTLRLGNIATYDISNYDASESFIAADSLARAIDQLLHGRTNVTLAGGYMLACERTSQLTLGETDAGKDLVRFMSTYQIIIQEF